MNKLNACFAAMILAALTATAPAAERKVGQRPAAGVESTATVGSTLLERFNMVVESAPKLRDDLQIELGLQGTIRVPSGSAFVVERSSPLKACTVAQDTYIDHFVGPRGAACLFDDDMDGKFDKASAASVMFTTKRIKAPAAYDIVDTPVDANSDYARQTLTFLGAAAGALHLSYREFSHDMARPAFTEELTFPMGETFPQTISWRDTKITLLGLGTEGLRYRLEGAIK